MQPATTLRTSTRAAVAQWTIAAIITLAMLVMAGAAALRPRAPYTARNVSAPVSTTHNRTFENEAGYVPSVSEYVSLSETYIPVTGEHTVYQPILRSRLRADQQAAIPSAAEYASGIWGEDYRVPAQPAEVASSLHNGSRLLANQRLDVVSAADYAGLPFAVDYSLAGTPR